MPTALAPRSNRPQGVPCIPTAAELAVLAGSSPFLYQDFNQSVANQGTAAGTLAPISAAPRFSPSGFFGKMAMQANPSADPGGVGCSAQDVPSNPGIDGDLTVLVVADVGQMEASALTQNILSFVDLAAPTGGFAWQRTAAGDHIVGWISGGIHVYVTLGQRLQGQGVYIFRRSGSALNTRINGAQSIVGSASLGAPDPSAPPLQYAVCAPTPTTAEVRGGPATVDLVAIWNSALSADAIDAIERTIWGSP